MSEKKKKRIRNILTLPLLAIVSLIMGYTIFIPGHATKDNAGNNPIAIMLDQGNGNYIESTSSSFTQEGYEFDHAQCQNGSIVTEKEDGISVKFTGSDHCTLYYSKVSDLSITSIKVNGTVASSVPDSASYTVTTDCGDTATSSWNYADWSLDISSPTKSSVKCSLEFNTPDNYNYLNEFIKNNVGTQQGETSAKGQLVNEGLATVTSLNSNATLTALSSASNYGTAQYNSTGGQISSKYTFSNSKWSNTAAMSSYIYNRITIPTDGFYKLYWTNTNTSSSYYFYVYEANSTTYKSSGNNKTSEQEVDYGYLKAGDYINIRAKSASANQITFYLKRSTNYTTRNVHRGYRYEGTDPYNYVSFNGELWRIIGLFAFDKSTNMESGNASTIDCSTYNCYTKIIRNDSIGSYAFSALNTSTSAIYNYWEKTDGTKATLNTLLNAYYYNHTDGTSDSSCRIYGNTVTGNCDFTKRGIQESYKPMVQQVVWNLGGYSEATNTQAMYGYERGSTRPSNNINALTASGYVGLMYPSDYGYSVQSSNCSRTGVNLSTYSSTAACGGKAWLLKNGYEWTITPISDNASNVFYVNSVGYVRIDYAFYGCAVRPVLYLTSKTYIVSGSGKIDDPYVLGLDTRS